MLNQSKVMELENLAVHLGARSVWHYGSSSQNDIETPPNDIDIAFLFSNTLPSINEISMIKMYYPESRVEFHNSYTKKGNKYFDDNLKYHFLLIKEEKSILFDNFLYSLQMGKCIWRKSKDVF